MPSSEVLYAVDGNVATITLNRPEVHNALTDPMFDEVVAGLRAAAEDDDVKVVVLKGEGKVLVRLAARMHAGPGESMRVSPRRSR